MSIVIYLTILIGILFSGTNRRKLLLADIFIFCGLPFVIWYLMIWGPWAQESENLIQRLLLLSNRVLTIPEQPFEFLFGEVFIKKVEIDGVSITVMSLGSLLVLPAISETIKFLLGKFSFNLSILKTFNLFFSQSELFLFVNSKIRNLKKGQVFYLLCIGFSSCASGTMLVYSNWLKMANSQWSNHIFASCILSIFFSGAIATRLMSTDAKWEGSSEKTNLKSEKYLARVTESSILGAKAIFAMLIVGLALPSIANGIDSLFNFILGSDVSVGFEDGCMQSRSLGPFRLIYESAKLMVNLLPGAVTDKSSLEVVSCIISSSFLENEFSAFKLMQSQIQTLNSATVLATTYLICHFTNFYTLGFQAGILHVLLPSRHSELPGLICKAFTVSVFSHMLLFFLAYGIFSV